MMNKFWVLLKNYRPIRAAKAKALGGFVKLNPRSKARGRILLSYTIFPFISRKHTLLGHSNRWECREIANIFLERGYTVDVIDFTNTKFIPKKSYDYFLDIHQNLERLAPLLNKDCTKILHLTTSGSDFQNKAEQKRIYDLEKRKGVKLTARRQIEKTDSIKHADYVSMLGNKFTESTYNLKGEKVWHIPISTTHTYPSPENKNFAFAKSNFIWFGGVGAVHKGLDLVLEAFREMPDKELAVMGKIENEKDFYELYKKELLDTPNIHYIGHVDPSSVEFIKIIENSVGLIYPSSSEGQSGAVVLSMHAGIIPIISKNSGVGVNAFGIILKENTIEEIKKQIEDVSNLPEEKLKEMSVKTWKYAREHHTRERFSEEFKKFINYIENNESNK